MFKDKILPGNKDEEHRTTAATDIEPTTTVTAHTATTETTSKESSFSQKNITETKNTNPDLFSSSSSSLSELSDSDAETERMTFSQRQQTGYPLDSKSEFKSQLMEAASTSENIIGDDLPKSSASNELQPTASNTSSPLSKLSSDRQNDQDTAIIVDHHQQHNNNNDEGDDNASQSNVINGSKIENGFTNSQNKPEAVDNSLSSAEKSSHTNADIENSSPSKIKIDEENVAPNEVINSDESTFSNNNRSSESSPKSGFTDNSIESTKKIGHVMEESVNNLLNAPSAASHPEIPNGSSITEETQLQTHENHANSISTNTSESIESINVDETPFNEDNTTSSDVKRALDDTGIKRTLEESSIAAGYSNSKRQKVDSSNEKVEGDDEIYKEDNSTTKDERHEADKLDSHDKDDIKMENAGENEDSKNDSEKENSSEIVDSGKTENTETVGSIAPLANADASTILKKVTVEEGPEIQEKKQKDEVSSLEGSEEKNSNANNNALEKVNNNDLTEELQNEAEIGGDEDEDAEEEEDEEDEDLNKSNETGMKDVSAEEQKNLTDEGEKVDEEQRQYELEQSQIKQAKDAIDKLTEIEIDFAKLKDKLYEDKLKTFEQEIQMCINGIHPTLKSLYSKIEEYRTEKLQQINNRKNYQLLNIDRSTRAQRAAIHQQHISEKNEIKFGILNDLTLKWYDINRDRKVMNSLTPEYSYRIPISESDNSIQPLVDQLADVNDEIQILETISEKFGFPVASRLTSGTNEEIVEDFTALGLI